ncbi:MAG: magnesium chelatase, partial [Proteobacteria bacterium]|nr:magnesium chelatase [Pseudomonadota bacterium]
SNAERRAILLNDPCVVPRICDLAHALPGMTGKIELVFEGEQEGPAKVSKALIGKAVREVFKKYFPDPLVRKSRSQEGQPKHVDRSDYDVIVDWFEGGNKIEISDDMPVEAFYHELHRVPGLKALTTKYMKIPESSKHELASAMEFVLDSLHQCSRIAKDEVNNLTSYKDLVQTLFTGRTPSFEEEL